MIALVRHGETEGNAARVFQRPEVPLNARGLAQADRLAERLHKLGLARLICSDLLRARMTAAAIERASGLSAELFPELQERNFGALRGRSYAQVGSTAFAPDYEPEGGESIPVFETRVAVAWQRILEAASATAGNVVVVTHGLVCGVIGRRFLALGDRQPARWGNTSVTLFEPEAPQRVHVLNCVEHLDPDDDDRASPSGL